MSPIKISIDIIVGLEGQAQQEEGQAAGPAKVQLGIKGSGSEARLQPRRKILNPQRKMQMKTAPLQVAPRGVQVHPEVPIPGGLESVQQLARTGEEGKKKTAKQFKRKIQP